MTSLISCWCKPIKSNTLLVKSLDDHKYGCLLCIIPRPLRDEISDWLIENLHDEHLAPDGRDLRPHVTVLYGFRDDSEETIQGLRALLSRHGPIRIKLGNELSVFPTGKDGVPLKVDVISQDLHELNAAIRDSFDVEVKYPTYAPHLTLAYLTEDAKDIYLEEQPPFLGQEIILSEVEWSGSDGRKETIPLSFLPSLRSDNKAMSYLIKDRGQPCKPHERADETGCIPAKEETGQGNEPGQGSVTPQQVLDPTGKPANTSPQSEQQNLLGVYQPPTIKEDTTRLTEREIKANQMLLDKLFGPDFKIADLAAMSNAVDGSSVSVHPVGENRLECEVNNLEMGLSASREFVFDKDGELAVENEWFGLTNQSPLKGKGYELFVKQVLALKTFGVKRIETHAAGLSPGVIKQYGLTPKDIPGQGKWNGYYTWPRLGYDGTIQEQAFKRLPVELQQQLGESRSVLDLYALPGGAAAWKNFGSDIYDAHFDLSDGSRNMQVLENYIRERRERDASRTGQATGDQGTSEQTATGSKSWKTTRSTDRETFMGTVARGWTGRGIGGSARLKSAFHARKDMSWVASGSGGALVKPPQYGDKEEKAYDDALQQIQAAVDACTEKELDGVEVYFNTDTPHIVIIDVMDWGDEEVGRKIGSAASKAVGDESNVIFHNEGGKPTGDSWVRVKPKRAKKSLAYRIKGQGQPCEPHERADLTGCISAKEEQGVNGNEQQSQPQQTSPRLDPEGYPVTSGSQSSPNTQDAVPPTPFTHAQRSGAAPTRPQHPNRGSAINQAGDVRRIVEEARREAAQNEPTISETEWEQRKQEISAAAQKQNQRARSLNDERHEQFLEKVRKRGGKITGLLASDKPIARALEAAGKLERRGSIYYLKSIPPVFGYYKSLDYFIKARGQPCKPGETAALTGCIPSTNQPQIQGDLYLKPVDPNWHPSKQQSTRKAQQFVQNIYNKFKNGMLLTPDEIKGLPKNLAWLHAQTVADFYNKVVGALNQGTKRKNIDALIRYINNQIQQNNSPGSSGLIASTSLQSTIPFKNETIWETGNPQPGTLNGIDFAQAPPKFWEKVQDAAINEPPPVPGKKVDRVGVMIQEPDGRVWIVTPTNEYGGRKHTLPGGTVEPGLSNQQNALKEVWEETGLQVEITGHLGDFEDSNTKRNGRLYIGKRIGGAPWDAKVENSIINHKTGKPDAESDSVKLVTPERAASLLHRTDDLAQLMSVNPIKLDHPVSGKGSEPLRKFLKGIESSRKAYEDKRTVAGLSTGNGYLHVVQNMRGFNNKPKVVSKKDMDDLVTQGTHIEVLRGLRSHGSESADVLADQFRNGQHYPGYGIYGSGTYSDSKKGSANQATCYNGYGKSGAMLRIAIPKTAKIVKASELIKSVPNRPDVFDGYPTGKTPQECWRGVQAALAGYDAIYVDKSTGGSADVGYYVILNRGIVTVQKEDATGHVI